MQIVKSNSEFFKTLQTRFEKNMNRHKNIKWLDVLKKLETKSNSKKIISLLEMEKTGGEPDVVGYDSKTNEYIFFDCSKETPLNRRNYCYDDEALKKRKIAKPKDSVLNVAEKIGIEVLSEEEYRELQKLGEFDLKTSSWIVTPVDIRKLGGALFADRRYGKVFIYHNGAESYYASRGFRGKIRV